MLCPVRICKHEGKQKYLLRMHGRAGSASAPFSRSVAGAVVGGGGRGRAPPPPPAGSRGGGGGGGEPAGRVLPGILSREGGIFAL
jgi:hypothetical protein